MKLKTDTNTVKNFSTAYVAGILIGFGVIINLTIEYPIIGALFFGFGLLTIIAMGLPLYTGRVGFWKEPKTFPLMIIGNVAGAFSTVVIYILSKPEFISVIRIASINKFQKSYFQMLCCGILCGMLIHFAVKVKNTATTFLAVAIFILIGAEHCIADFPYLLFNFSLDNLIKWIIVVVSNSVGAIIIEILVTEKINEICGYYNE